MPTVKTDPILEAIAKKLSGFATVDKIEQSKMIHRAAKAGREAASARIAELESNLAVIMSVLPEDTKPSDVPELIMFFKRQMGAYSKKYMDCESAIKEEAIRQQLRYGKYQEHIRELEAQVEAMKCCGNCGSCAVRFTGHAINCKGHNPNEKPCKEWNFDKSRQPKGGAGE